MTVRIGINGFGRVARQVIKRIQDTYPEDFDIVAVNSIRTTESLAYLFKYDSVYGISGAEVNWDDHHIIINDKKIMVLSGMEPSLIPWEEAGADIVIEATGHFNNAAMCHGHLEHGVERVIITAPGKNVDITVVPGVNDDKYNPSVHRIVSCASCTTNCAAPLAKVLNDHFGIKRGFLTTVHSYTGDQSLTDKWHKDPRRARAAAVNIVPTTTGAAKALGEVMPELQGKMHGIAYRVPVPAVSLVELVVDLKCEKVTVDEVHTAFWAASQCSLSGILEVSDKPLVSSDFIGNSASAIVDSLSTEVTDDNMVRVVAWYDNEWGYSCRVADLTFCMAKKVISPANNNMMIPLYVSQ